MEWMKVCPAGEVPEGLTQADVGNGNVLLLRSGDTFYACQSVCPHLDTPLAEGMFDGTTLTCHQHLWQWDLAAGGEALGLAEMPLQTYEVKEEDGVVFVRGEF